MEDGDIAQFALPPTMSSGEAPAQDSALFLGVLAEGGPTAGPENSHGSGDLDSGADTCAV